MQEIQIYLNAHSLNAERVAQISNVPVNEILCSGQSFNDINIKVLRALGMLDDTPTDIVLRELIDIHGNPIIDFIQRHPSLDADLVHQVEDLMIELHEDQIDITDVTFNRYYAEDADTTQRAELCLRRLCEVLREKKDLIDKGELD